MIPHSDPISLYDFVIHVSAHQEQVTPRISQPPFPAGTIDDSPGVNATFVFPVYNNAGFRTLEFVSA
jgi:hypothetical protein